MMKSPFKFCLQTCGEETEQECMKAFFDGAPGYFLHEVRNVTPAVVALNLMMRLTHDDEFGYLIPLDSDMILYPNFLERIEKAVRNAEGQEDWHTILFPLWDTLTQEKIMALKVFRNCVVKDFTFVDRPCPDIQHYKDLTNAGYVAINLMHQDPIGDHVVKGNYFCYAKYRDLYNVAQAYPETILESHFKGGTDLRTRANYHFLFFTERYKETGNDDYLYCIAGMVEGLMIPRLGNSKNLGDREMRVKVEDGKRLFRKWSGRRHLV